MTIWSEHVSMNARVSCWPDVNKLCGSGAVGQSALFCALLWKPGALLLLGRGFGCLKLLLSEKSDCDSAAVTLKGNRDFITGTSIGTTRHGLVRPGGGDGESLLRIWVERRCESKSEKNQTEKNRSEKKRCVRFLFWKLPVIIFLHSLYWWFLEIYH